MCLSDRLTDLGKHVFPLHTAAVHPGTLAHKSAHSSELTMFARRPLMSFTSLKSASSNVHLIPTRHQPFLLRFAVEPCTCVCVPNVLAKMPFHHVYMSRLHNEQLRPPSTGICAGLRLVDAPVCSSFLLPAYPDWSVACAWACAARAAPPDGKTTQSSSIARGVACIRMQQV